MKRSNRVITLLVVTVFCLGAVGLSCDPVDEEIPVSSLSEKPGLQGIVGGHETNYEEWKGVIGLWTGLGLCTGSLLAPDVVLSAGHCVFYKSWNQLENTDFVNNPQDLQILGGAVIGEEQYSWAEKVVKHPNWNGSLGGNAVDLSMIKLEEPIEGIETYGVRREAAPAKGSKGWIVGYGKSVNNDDMSAGTHRAGETTVKSVNNRVLGLATPSGTCQGDSGGPFFSEQDGEWVITAITSYGAGFCGPNVTGYSVNVVTYQKWIEETFLELTGEELNPGSDSDGDTDTDVDGDSDSDTDTDVDGDSDGDSDSDSDADSNPDGGEEADSGSGNSSCRILTPGTQHSLVPLLQYFI
ncbi:MAG: trypsin-like serine protease [Deltaproteobacteria bacterium]|nr:trypsin-like serine protease [Deltaproteobacteria bacterium]